MAPCVSAQLWVQAMEKYVETRANIEKQIKSFRDPTYDRYACLLAGSPTAQAHVQGQWGRKKGDTSSTGAWVKRLSTARTHQDCKFPHKGLAVDRTSAHCDSSFPCRLLPDQRPEMKSMGIKTLVLDLNDVLVSKEWTRKKGWTLYKRPGAQVHAAGARGRWEERSLGARQVHT